MTVIQEGNMVLLGSKIRELRTKYNLTQAELANQIGISKATVTAYEGDLRQPSYDVLIKLANVFKVSIDSLVLNRSESILDVSDLGPEQINEVQGYIKYLKEQELVKHLFLEESIDIEAIEKLRKEWNKGI